MGPELTGWQNEEEWPTLSHMDGFPLYYLAWTCYSNGDFGQLRWSSQGIATNGEPELEFAGKHDDVIRMNIINGLTPLGYPSAPDSGFRYLLNQDIALVVPTIGYTETNAPFYFGLTSVPYFIYYRSGQPALPYPSFSSSLAVARQLKAHCRYEEALKWCETHYVPITSDNAWGDGPIEEFQAEKRAFLQFYLELLLNYGEHLMHENTGESFRKASLIFEMAKRIMGECPPTLKEQLPNTDVSIIDYEASAPELSKSLMLAYQRVEDQLNLIKNCIHSNRINTCKQSMEFWSNPDLKNNNCKPCSDLDLWKMSRPRYPYDYYFGKAQELTNMAISFGNSLLTAEEKADGAYLTSILGMQQLQLNELTIEVFQRRYQAAVREKESIEKAIIIANVRLIYLIGMTPYGQLPGEQNQISKFQASIIELYIAEAAELLGQTVGLLPDYLQGTPFSLLHLSPPMSGSKSFSITRAVAGVARALSQIHGIEGSMSKQLATDIRQEDDRLHRITELILEIQKLNIDLQAAIFRVQATNRELKDQQLRIEHSRQVLDFHRDKSTNEVLYNWMKGELRSAYKKVVKCAYYYAKLAEREYQINCCYSDETFINGPFWNDTKNGWLAGEKLQVSLLNLQKANEEKCYKQYEIVKNIALRIHDPLAFLQIKYSDQCIFELKEAYFVKDFPGHYGHQLMNAYVSIPAITGPSTNVNCTLTQLSSRIRKVPYLLKGEDCCNEDGNSSGYAMQNEDDRFVFLPGSDESIATSKAIEDAGRIEVNNRSPQKPPFMGTGLFSLWCISLPKATNHFPKGSISDINMKVVFKTKEGGPLLAKAALDHYKNYLPGNGKVLVDLRSDHPEEWYKMNSRKEKTFSLRFGKKHLPYITFNADLSIIKVDLFVETVPCPPCNNFEVFYRYPEDQTMKDCDDVLITCKQIQHWSENVFHGVLEESFEIGNQISHIGDFCFPDYLEIVQAYLLVSYKAEAKVCDKHKVHCGC